ncbi:TPA: hypothetical protein EYO77_04255, partial [Candidatus Poribacteria bacterium]|nr:hypothetical protein [Candidatus Poribacteria bacterium]
MWNDMVLISSLSWNFRNFLSFFLNLSYLLIRFVSILVLLILHIESLRADTLPVIQIEYLLNGEILDQSSILSQALTDKTEIEYGYTISLYKIRQCVEAIYSIGEFSQVRAVEKKTESGIILVFQLTSKTRIAEIKFDGNILDRDFVLERIRSNVEQEYSEEIAQKDVKHILNLYMDYGYFNARVRFSVPPKERVDDEILLRFEIVPYARATIEAIKFVGNLALSDKDIQNIIEIKSKQFYQKKTVEKELRRLRELYRQEGYLSVQVT